MNLNLDNLTPIEVPFNYRGQNYVLDELTGEGATVYREDVLKASSIPETDVAQRVCKLLDADLRMLTYSIRKKDGSRVSVEELKTWPQRFLKALSQKVRVISELSGEDGAGEENPTQGDEPTNTPVG